MATLSLIATYSAWYSLEIRSKSMQGSIPSSPKVNPWRQTSQVWQGLRRPITWAGDWPGRHSGGRREEEEEEEEEEEGVSGKRASFFCTS